MKIIISHDVDHLYGTDHLRDLIYPKLWVRETMDALRGRISFDEWRYRMVSPFRRERNHVNELLEYDAAHGVKSSFFFGMEKGLGMSYDRDKALPFIENVIEKGFHAGVHGIAYDDVLSMQGEHDAFEQLTGSTPEGIRMHYVRFDDKTFERLAPGSMGVRHFVPFVFVLSIAVLGIGGLFITPAALLLAVEMLLYAVIDGAFSIKNAEGIKEFIQLFSLYFLFHMSYGAGTAVGLCRRLK